MIFINNIPVDLILINLYNILIMSVNNKKRIFFMQAKRTSVFIEPDILKKLQKVKDTRQKETPHINITYRALIHEFLESALKNVK